MASKKPSYEELKRKVESLEKRLSSVTRAMKKIRVREKKYSFIAENSSDIILMADDRARYTYISPSHELHLKRGDEILGEIIFDHIHPEDKDRTREIFFALFETREPARVEYRYNHPERGYIWLESTGQPFLTDDGSVQVVIISREVTKRRQAEDELKASEERFRAIFESSDDFIFLKDSELRYVMANPATQELFGLSSTEIMGKVDSELFGAEAAAHIENSDLRVLKGEILEEVDSKPVNGIFRTYHVKKTPV
ncbi:MAG: PAS domain-containing protein, partial [Thermodesulfobacteriota bacterium]